MNNEFTARMTKANKLMEVIVAAGGTSETTARMSDDQWKLAEQAARVRPASVETRAMVVRFVKIREEVKAMPDEALFARMKD
jgi:hypothetical protein